MDFYVVLDRAGRRVARRRRAPGRVGPSHRVFREESVKWFQQKVNGFHLCFVFWLLPYYCLVRWYHPTSEAQGKANNAPQEINLS